MAKKVIRLTERDLTRIVKRVISEQMDEGTKILQGCGISVVPEACKPTIEAYNQGKPTFDLPNIKECADSLGKNAMCVYNKIVKKMM